MRKRPRPLIAYYKARNMLYTIDADAAPETVFSSVIAVMNKMTKAAEDRR